MPRGHTQNFSKRASTKVWIYQCTLKEARTVHVTLHPSSWGLMKGAMQSFQLELLTAF